MKIFSDNILKGSQSWKAPYKFLVCRKSKKDSSIEVLGWTAEPDTAYAAFMRVSEEAEVNKYDYFLHDSFHKDAEDFCREAYEVAVEMLEDFEDI